MHAYDYVKQLTDMQNCKYLTTIVWILDPLPNSGIQNPDIFNSN